MLSKKNYAFIAVVFLSIVLWFQTSYWYKNYLVDRHIVSINSELITQSKQLKKLLDQKLHLAKGLAEFVEHQLNVNSENNDHFVSAANNFMSAMYLANSNIRGFSIAPDGIVAQVFPFEPNKAAISYNLLSEGDPELIAVINRAIEQREITYVAPYELQQGGLGLVGRFPVFNRDQVWGVVGVIIDFLPVLETAGLVGINSKFHIAIRDNKKRVFFGEAKLFEQPHVIARIEHKTGAWEIAAQPKMSNQQIENQAITFKLFFAGFMLMIIGIMYAFYQHTNLVKLSNSNGTNKLDDINNPMASAETSTTQPKPTWLTPALASVAIVLGSLSFFQFMQSHDNRAESIALSEYLSNVVNIIDHKIEANRVYVELLAAELAEDNLSMVEFEDKATTYVNDHAGLINIAYADEHFVIRHTAPYEKNKQIIGLTLSLPEPERASRLAQKLRRTVPTKPFTIIQGDVAFEFYSPIYHHNKFKGTLSAVYSIRQLLESMIPSHISDKFHISIFNEQGDMLYRSSGSDLSITMAHRQPLTSIDNGLWISLSTKKTQLNDGMRIILLVLLLFVAGVVFSFWLQFKESDRVWRTGKSIIESQQHFHSISSSAPIAVVITHPDSGEILYANYRAEELFSSLGSKLEGRNVKEFYANPEERKLFLDYMHHKHRVDGFEVQIRTDEGQIIWGSLSSKMVDYSDGKGIITSITDLTQQRNYQDQLYLKANFDELTGLPNRGMAFERLSTAIHYAKYTNGSVVLMLLDLDDFKKVNDSFGHNAGDDLLKQISIRIKEVISPEDTLARLGGDEFVLILSEQESIDRAAEIAEHVIEICAKPIILQHYEVVVGCSIGLARYPQDGLDYETLTKNADAAMYESKLSGRSAHRFYSDKMSLAIQERVVMENELRNALRKDELFVVYQPIIDGDTGGVIGAEALLRWKNERLGYVSPDKFIPLAESLGLISLFGEWVLDQACYQVKRWMKLESAPKYVSVNVSSRQLRNEVIIEDVKLALMLHQLPASVIELELTESALIENTDDNQRIFDTLHQMGVRLAVDDFGTGYSSLSYLRRFSFDTLKIDRSFISDIPSQQDATQLVKAISSMATSLGMKIVAEGVETKEQLAFLQDLQCSAIQGYFIAKPLMPDELVRFCETRKVELSVKQTELT
ncbi:MAG: EAL domain-containing protein [Parashewanella sp.]